MSRPTTALKGREGRLELVMRLLALTWTSVIQSTQGNIHTGLVAHPGDRMCSVTDLNNTRFMRVDPSAAPA